ncbi:MAG: ABC transporter permease [Nitrososphaeria archaeon]|nr:ABC transporter permease [Nitrososphaeria archaeon]
MPGILTVASKEFSDILKSRRFIILVTIFLLLTVAAQATLYMTFSSIGITLPRGFLGSAAYSLISIMSSFAPIIGLALGFDSISGEREKGTLKIVLAQPVYRDAFFNGKFLAAIFAVSLALFISSVINVAGAIFVLKITPTIEEVFRIIIFMLFSILFATTYYAIAAFLSVVCKRSSQSMILSIVLWALFTFVITIIAALIAFIMIPIRVPAGITITSGGGVVTITQVPNATGTLTFTPPEIQQYESEMMARVQIMTTISSVTPNYHFSRIAEYVLGVYAAGGVGAGTTASISLISSLVYALPNMLVLTIVTILFFIASYMIFTRQEIR